MDNEKWSFKPSDLVTIPNIITYVRFIMVVPFMYFFIHEQYILSAVCIGISGLSDCFDGMLARKLNQVTSLGKILDPIADKVTLFSVVVCMLIYMPSLLWLFILLMVKEFIMLLCGFILLLKKYTPPAARWYGKFATVVFYFSVCLIIFLKAALGYESVALVTVMFIITAVTMFFALANYAYVVLKMIKEKKSGKE